MKLLTRDAICLTNEILIIRLFALSAAIRRRAARRLPLRDAEGRANEPPESPIRARRRRMSDASSGVAVGAWFAELEVHAPGRNVVLDSVRKKPSGCAPVSAHSMRRRAGR